MIGHRDLHTTAANPNFEMGTLYVRQNSAANVALLDVPRRSGIAITRVWMRVTNCDGVTADYDAVRTGTMWVVDVPGTHFATPGEVPGGVDVWASGDGADGDPYAWSIGTGSLCVREGDNGAPVPGVAWTAIKLREAVPDNPAYGDAKIAGGALYVWDGTTWVGGGGGGGGGIVDPTLDPTSANAVANSAVCGGLDAKLDRGSDNYAFNDTIGGLEVQVEDHGGQTSSYYVFSRAGEGAANSVARLSDIPTVPTASASNPVMDGTASAGTASTYARGDHRHPTDTTRAPTASPALTGTPTAPTAAGGTNTTQIATTAFVQSELAGKVSGALGSGGWVVTNGQRDYVFASDALADDDITIARIADLRYAKHVLTTPAGSATLLDRADNLYVGDSTFTSCTFTLPAARDGKIRDFLLDVDNSGNTSALGMEFYGLGTAFALGVDSTDVSSSKTAGEVLAEMTVVEAGTRARLYFTETAQTVTVGSTTLPVISIQRLSIATATVRGGA